MIELLKKSEFSSSLLLLGFFLVPFLFFDIPVEDNFLREVKRARGSRCLVVESTDVPNEKRGSGFLGVFSGKQG